MNYSTYKDKLKLININGVTFSKILDFHKDTPSSLWKKKNEIPKTISVVLELLEKMPEDERVLFIHHKLKEAEN
ncbi:hypothetical protein ThvES_00018290 [Thiovulum sp. ES]|nr:hypothetical protein ThvES_00018290 [Thiovulum sp. ES]